MTTIGIMIGIGTVILVLSAGEGFKSYINSQVEAFGSNIIIAQTSLPATTKARSSSGLGSNEPNSAANNAVPITTLKIRDVEDIKNLPNIKNAYGASIGHQVVTYKDVSKNVFVFGGSAERFDIDKNVIAEGRSYTF